jgi:MoxR-like ATPase
VRFTGEKIYRSVNDMLQAQPTQAQPTQAGLSAGKTPETPRTAATKPVNIIPAKIREIERAANEKFVDRADVVHGLSLALVSKHHLYMLGPAGTGKSALTRWMTGRIAGAAYFDWLLTRFSTPEELFGALDLNALKSGTYKRITTNKLPETQISFLDEIFKANSAILNALLTAAQERIYHNNGHPTKIPLWTIVGASNELPESDESLAAFYDRLLLRYSVEYTRTDDDFMRVLKSAATPQAPATLPEISAAEIEQAQAATENMPIEPELYEAIRDIRNELRKRGIIVSDRRYVQAIRVMQADAYLAGETAATADTIECGANIFWDKPEQARDVKIVCTQLANPALTKAEQLLEASEEAINDALRKKDAGEKTIELGVQLHIQLKKAFEECESMSRGRPGKVLEIANKIKQLDLKAVHEIVGIK